MGNSNSMNNLSMIDHKRQTTEFLRYSQIPYESQFRSPNSNSTSHLNIHEIGKLRSSTNYPPNPNPVKVLPDVKFEPKLRTTNNGAILQSGGTISGRKDTECGLHRSKSISESQNTYLSNPNGTAAQPSPPVFKMQRASTQLSINHRAPSKPNLPRHYDDTVKLETVEVKFKKTHDMQKAHRAPQPPISINKNIPYRGNNQKEVGPKQQQQQQQHSVNPSPAVSNQNQRLFGDTLTKKMDPRLKTSISASTQNLNSPKIRMQKPETPLNPVKPNMTSYLRRERTFDMTLMTDVGKKREEIKPKFSPQFQRKNRQLTTQERYKANVTSQPPPIQTSMPQTSAISKQRPINVKSHEKMKTIDRKQVKKKPSETSVVELFADAKNAKVSNDNSTVSNTGNSVSSSFNYLKGPSTQNAQNIIKKQPEIVKSNSPIAYSRESPIRQVQQTVQQQQQQQQSPNNFYYELKETPVDSETNDDDKNEVNHAQMDIVNKFAEDILKMSTFDVSQTEVMTESTTSEDYEDMNILLALRPTLPRRQLQIPHFSPLAAWRSIEIDINNLNDSKNSKLSSSSSQLQLINEDTKLETKIEKIYREPSFNLQQLDNKSGDSGISADKEIGNSPDSMQIPQAYLISSWTPQQDLEEDEESIDGHDMNYQLNSDNNSQQQAATNGRMFSLSLPRDNQSSSDKLNNFYSLQKFKKAVVDVYEYSDTRIQCHNYGSDNNWLLSSQPNSIDELSSKKEKEKNQIISQMRSGKHIMYLPSHWNDDSRQIESHKMIQQSSIIQSNEIENENVNNNIHYLHKEIEDTQHAKKSSSSSKNRFKFQSTIRQVERRKIAEKLSKEAEEKEMMRLSELEAMQKVEEEFQKKRLREKSRLRHQLRIVSLEESYDGPHYNFRHDIDPSVDTRTPYISKIIEAKSPKRL